MNKRKTIGSNPLDAVVPMGTVEVTEVRPMVEIAQEPEIELPAPQTKQRLTVHLPVELIDRAKNVVFWTPGLTLASLAEQALEAVVTRLEEERGEAFPWRFEELRGGRPLK